LKCSIFERCTHSGSRNFVENCALRVYEKGSLTGVTKGLKMTASLLPCAYRLMEILKQSIGKCLEVFQGIEILTLDLVITVSLENTRRMFLF
jgi:hypothetical protein